MAEAEAMQAGTVHVACPEYGAVLPVPVSCHMENSEHSHLGECRMVCEPDLSDVWAHMWVHDSSAPGDEEGD